MNPSEFHNMATVEPTHWWFTGMAAIAADWLKQAINGARGLVLDAGCGTGGNMGWLTQFGRPCGVDAHPLALRWAAAHGCPWLVRADVQALPFASDRFAVVTSFDALSDTGVTSDWEALRELARVLQPGGWLLLRLPAYEWLRSGHDRAVHTRHRYTRAEVISKLRSVGLRPVRISYLNTVLFPLAVAWRLLRRHNVRSDVRALPGWLNGLFALCLRMERVWLRRRTLPVGLSVLALARKETR